MSDLPQMADQHGFFRQGSDALVKALAGTGGYQSTGDRFRTPVGASRLAGMRRTDGASGDRRPTTVTADPCPRCSVRGDHPEGCSHQRPDPAWLAGREPRQ